LDNLGTDHLDIYSCTAGISANDQYSLARSK
jgi:hypothetical protein